MSSLNRIVVIEDDPAILRAVADNLRYESYDVLTAADGEAGYKLIREKHPDLVILDLMLPGLNGFDVCQKLRSDGLLTPIVMLTAQDQEAKRVEGFDVGADDYVTKPFSVRELLSRVRAILRRSLSKELDEARQIQEKLLPAEIPQIRGCRIAGAWLPARVVGGDYFDVLKFDDDTVALCIADVSGKGLPAALLMANLQATVKAYASKQMRPREMCETINRVMYDNIARNKFITFFYAMLFADQMQLIYSNAGHNPPIVSARDGSAMLLERGGAVLGVFKEWQYEEGQISLEYGDRFVLYTDGITEARNGAGEEFGETRLLEMLTRTHTIHATGLTQCVIDAATNFSNREFDDDLTVLAVSID